MRLRGTLASPSHRSASLCSSSCTTWTCKGSRACWVAASQGCRSGQGSAMRGWWTTSPPSPPYASCSSWVSLVSGILSPKYARPQVMSDFYRGADGLAGSFVRHMCSDCEIHLSNDLDVPMSASSCTCDDIDCEGDAARRGPQSQHSATPRVNECIHCRLCRRRAGRAMAGEAAAAVHC